MATQVMEMTEVAARSLHVTMNITESKAPEKVNDC